MLRFPQHEGENNQAEDLDREPTDGNPGEHGVVAHDDSMLARRPMQGHLHRRRGEPGSAAGIERDPGHMLATEPVWEVARDLFAEAERKELAVKGRAQTVVAYERRPT